MLVPFSALIILFDMATRMMPPKSEMFQPALRGAVSDDIRTRPQAKFFGGPRLVCFDGFCAELEL
jgi:hypothetical protein